MDKFKPLQIWKTNNLKILILFIRKILKIVKLKWENSGEKLSNHLESDFQSCAETNNAC